MKTLLDAGAADTMTARVMRLSTTSHRHWGTMTVAQAVAHMSGGIEMALGDQRPPRMVIGRILGLFIKPLVFGNDEPLRRNTPTVKRLCVVDERDLVRERQRLIALITRFTTAGRAGCTAHPHGFFGRLTPDEWAILMYKHLDHHLRQYDA